MKKTKNDIMILEFIHQRKATSRVELSKLLNISEAAVSKRVKMLIDEGYLKENKEKNRKTGGRNARGLEINRDIGRVIGIYLGLENITISLSDIEGKILKTEKQRIEQITKVKEQTFKLLKKFIQGEKVIGIGVGMNGIVDSQRGISIYSAPYGWNNVEIKKELEREYKVPIFLENGVNLIALYEKYMGSCKENSNFIVLNIGTGVKAGIILEDRIFSGKNFTVGEVGHIPYDFSKEAYICSCGNKGCIETLLSDWCIERKVHKLVGKEMEYDEIIQKANRGDKIYKEVILEMIPVLSTMIFWLTTMINPEKIVIYGKLYKCDEFFWRELKRKIKECSLTSKSTSIIEKFEYDSKLIAQGAIILVMNNIFRYDFRYV